MTKPVASGATSKPEAAPVGRVLVVGATGDIGRATVQALLKRGHDVLCVVRPRYAAGGPSAQATLAMLSGAEVRFAEVADPASVARDGFRDERFDAVVSCLASRTGASDDAWAIDYRANLNVLAAAQSAGVGHFVLLSALCVQKPRLASSAPSSPSKAPCGRQACDIRSCGRRRSSNPFRARLTG